MAKCTTVKLVIVDIDNDDCSRWGVDPDGGKVGTVDFYL